jgi:hypothetical protein
MSIWAAPCCDPVIAPFFSFPCLIALLSLTPSSGRPKALRCPLCGTFVAQKCGCNQVGNARQVGGQRSRGCNDVGEAAPEVQRDGQDLRQRPIVPNQIPARGGIPARSDIADSRSRFKEFATATPHQGAFANTTEIFCVFRSP